jgi:hypothetical protein
MLGRRLSLRRLSVCLLLAFVLLVHAPAHAQGIRVIFLHHSCGQNLIEEGGVREGLAALGYAFYDHGYNDDGLRLADGTYTGTDFDVPDDNTDPDGFAAIFAQPLHDPPDNTFSYLMQYDVIAFKSCYPASNIGDDAQLAAYRSYYLSIRDRMDQYPDKVFVVVTQPPQVPGNSDAEEAARARAFVDWLQSDEYLDGHPNVFVFGFFGLLAAEDNLLRPEYRYDDYDGHPNERANREIGPLFVAFVDEAIRSHSGGAPRPTAAPGQPVVPVEPPPEGESVPIAAPAMGVVDDFEGDGGGWGTDAEPGSSVECGVESGTAHGGERALAVRFRIAPDGWVDCGRSFDGPQDWSSAGGLSLWLHPAEAGQWVTLMLFSGAPDAPTPFEVEFEVAEAGWNPLFFAWSDLDRAAWADEDGLAEIDPSRVIGYGFSIGAGDTASEGILRVDDVSLAAGEGQPPVEGGLEEEVPPEGPADEPAGGLCPLSTFALPLGALACLLVRGRARRGSGSGAQP